MNGSNGYNIVAYRAKNGVCTLYVGAVFGLGANSEYKIANTIDAKYLPDLVCYCPLAYRQSNNVANVWIPAKTLEDNHLYIYSTYDNSTNVNSINGIVSWVYQHSVSRIIKTKQIDTTTDSNGYFQTGLNAKQIPIGIGGLSDARYAFHTGNEADNGRTIRLMAWDGSVGRYSNKYVNVIVYYIEV